MRLNEIKFFQDKYDDQFSLALARFVREKGLNLSHGGQARVLWIEGKTWVWRSWFNDAGYERFLKYVELNKSNPHLPKILSRVREEPVKFKGMPKDMTIKYVKLEKLAELEPSRFSDAVDAMFYGLDNYRGEWPKTANELADIFVAELKLPTHSDETPEDVAEEVRKYPKFFETVLDLIKNRRGNDMSSGNVMMRGDVPVIIDPFRD